MAPFGPFAALIKVKTLLAAMVQNEVCPRDEIADFPGANMLLIDRQDFAEGFVSFCTLCGVYSAAVRFAPNRAIVWDSL